MKLIGRPLYIDQLIQNIGVDLIKIITGMRRSGKSSILDLFHRHLLDSGIADEQHIVHINLESLKYRHLTDYLSLYEHVSGNIVPGKRTYLLFDEIQSVSGWEKAIESLRLDHDVDIYLTGSNAYLLSSELSTLLSGRYVEIPVFPLSFKEFLTFNEFPKGTSPEEKFRRYLQIGGMPVLGEYAFNEARIQQALEGIYSTVILKDVLQRNQGADQATLQKVVRFLCSNIGSITSPNSIGNVLAGEGDVRQRREKGMAGRTVERYVEMLRNAFFLFSVGRFDVKGKQLLKTLGKNYIVDLGFRNLLLGYRDADRGHILENVVYLELLRRDYRVWIGKVGDAEVDFVAEKADERLYIQVTESMQAPETRERELRPLRMIQDNYEKIVLSMDRSFVTSWEGIKARNLIDWLLS